MKLLSWKNKVVLGVNAHPDDLDFAAGGTLAKAAQQGAAVYYAVFTNGNKGNAGDRRLTSRKLVYIRRQEQDAAAKTLGIQKVFYFGYEDCMLSPTLAAKQKLVRLIRRLKPDVVVGLDPSRFYSPSRNMVHHSDHRAAGEITIDAVYPLCRDRLCMPEAGPPHKVPYLLLATADDANYFENVSATLAIKIRALGRHKSQIAEPAAMPLFVKQWAQKRGRASRRYRLAESFRLLTLQRGTGALKAPWRK